MAHLETVTPAISVDAMPVTLLPDGRVVVDERYVLPRHPLEGCWCGEARFRPCAHQRAALGSIATGGVPVPIRPLLDPDDTRAASEAVTHPGVTERHWLRWIAQFPDHGWRLAGFAAARRAPNVVTALRALDDARVTAQFLAHDAERAWGEWRRVWLRQTPRDEGLLLLRQWARRRVAMSTVAVGALRDEGEGWAWLLYDAGLGRHPLRAQRLRRLL